MIFVDTNVFMYAVGRPHSLQSARGAVEAMRRLLREAGVEP